MDEIKPEVIGWTGYFSGNTRIFGREIETNRPDFKAIAIPTKKNYAPKMLMLSFEGVGNHEKLEKTSGEWTHSSCGIAMVSSDRISHSSTIAYSNEKSKLCQYKIRGIWCSHAPNATRTPDLPEKVMINKLHLNVMAYGDISEYAGSANFATRTNGEIMYIILTELKNKYNVLTFNGGPAESKMREMFPNHFCESVKSKSSSKNISLCQIPMTRILALRKKYKIDEKDV